MTTAQYLGWFDEVVEPTEGIFRKVEESFGDWKLTERSFTIGQLLAHLPLALRFNSRVLLQEQGVPTIREILIGNRRHPSATVDEAVRMLHESINEFKCAVGTYGNEEFLSKTIATPQKGNVPAWRFCAFVLEHHIHHLMELHLSLKILGVPVNTKTLYDGG